MKCVEEAAIAVAKAVKLCRAEVCPMYPITPSTHIHEKISEMINNGEMDAKMIDVESEHSALSAAIGSATVGARTFTATSSQGLAYMFEVLPIVAGMRYPVVMAVANRALSAPINIWNDHSDAVSARDQGWIQLYVESSQEALDTVIQAYRISENKDVLLPSMVCLDGFTLSHVWEPIEIPEQKKVDSFLPKYKAEDILDPAKPKTFGPIAFPNSFMEFKKMQEDAMQKALPLVEKTNSEFKKAFGRGYGNGLLEEYRMNDANYAMVAMGTVCGTTRVVVDELRKKGKKVGMIKLRSLRPFPKKGLQKACKGLKGLAVVDRHISLGYEGPLHTDVKSALYGLKTNVSNYIAGLGGRDITKNHLKNAFEELMKGREGKWLM